MRYSRSNTVEQVRKQWQKSPNQETVYGDRGHLKVLFNTKWVLNDLFNHLGSIWYHSEPLQMPYFPNQFFGLDFFCRFFKANRL